ncbi:MAG: hypothetical protein DIU68_012405 [Chloroflexota bacterium]|nr:MAG: hypothetical protein DIU68_00665 [Chloroflexota bacterium]
MWQRPRSSQQMIWIAIGMLLLGLFLGLMLTQSGFRWPMFFFFFWFGPWLFRGFARHRWHDWRREEEWENPKAKRKREAFEDEADEPPVQSEPSRYLLTDDGEIVEIVDPPPARAGEIGRQPYE